MKWSVRIELTKLKKNEKQKQNKMHIQPNSWIVNGAMETIVRLKTSQHHPFKMHQKQETKNDKKRTITTAMPTSIMISQR